MSVKHTERKRLGFFLLLAVAILLMATGVAMLIRIFAHYNELNLDRQDQQLQDMAAASDKSIAIQLDNIGEDLSYVLTRRGFVQAEAQWLESGDSDNLLFRMQENLVGQNPLIQSLLAIRDGRILLSTDGRTDYTFPFPSDRSAPQPCSAGDGTIYLALFRQTEHLEYAALIDLGALYDDLCQIDLNDSSRLMLLGTHEKLLLHQWEGECRVTAMEELTDANCDVQAVRYMLESRNSGQRITASYPLVYPDSTFVHEMRMTVIPLQECVNGYFIVGLTSDYDEIILPMHTAAVQLMIFAGMTIIGAVLLLALAVRLLYRGRQQDRELLRLKQRSEEIRRLLEKTQELAHHQRLETIGTLTASIAHEFNNLLTPIMGYSILTLEGLPEGADDLADNVTEIYEASRKAKTIISRLSDLSRRNTELTFRRLSLDDVVRRALDVAAPARPAHVEVATSLAGGEQMISGNETQLSQLLLNLIINAFHAMEDTGGTLTLTTEADGGGVILRVADGGCGIPPEAMPHIFEPFFTTKESGRGTGLGLAIVQQVAAAHSADLRAESTPGEGTVFTLRFPPAGEGNPADS